MLALGKENDLEARIQKNPFNNIFGLPNHFKAKTFGFVPKTNELNQNPLLKNHSKRV